MFRFLQGIIQRHLSPLKALKAPSFHRSQTYDFDRKFELSLPGRDIAGLEAIEQIQSARWPSNNPEFCSFFAVAGKQTDRFELVRNELMSFLLECPDEQLSATISGLMILEMTADLDNLPHGRSIEFYQAHRKEYPHNRNLDLFLRCFAVLPSNRLVLSQLGYLGALNLLVFGSVDTDGRCVAYQSGDVEERMKTANRAKSFGFLYSEKSYPDLLQEYLEDLAGKDPSIDKIFLNAYMLKVAEDIEYVGPDALHTKLKEGMARYCIAGGAAARNRAIVCLIEGAHTSCIAQGSACGIILSRIAEFGSQVERDIIDGLSKSYEDAGADKRIGLGACLSQFARTNVETLRSVAKFFAGKIDSEFPNLDLLAYSRALLRFWSEDQRFPHTEIYMRGHFEFLIPASVQHRSQKAVNGIAELLITLCHTASAPEGVRVFFDHMHKLDDEQFESVVEQSRYTLRRHADELSPVLYGAIISSAEDPARLQRTLLFANRTDFFSQGQLSMENSMRLYSILSDGKHGKVSREASQALAAMTTLRK